MNYKDDLIEYISYNATQEEIDKIRGIINPPPLRNVNGKYFVCERISGYKEYIYVLESEEFPEHENEYDIIRFIRVIDTDISDEDLRNLWFDTEERGHRLRRKFINYNSTGIILTYDEFTEITKEEFMRIYNKVLSEIQNSL